MKLIFATSNTDKLNEARFSLANLGFEVENIDFNFKEPYEGTLEEIARFKLSQIKTDYDIPTFVDDSGIFFEAYSNFPGIITKRIYRFIGYKGIDKLLANENRKAYFHGVVAVKWKNEIKVFHGKTHGQIITNIPTDLPNDLLFPFDPIFLPDNANTVLADMPEDIRLSYSYRRKALENMGIWINSKQILV